MVDSIGSSMSYNDLFRVDKKVQSTNEKVENTNNSDNREKIKESVMEAASDTRLSQNLRGRFDRYESQISNYEEQYNKFSTQKDSYDDVAKSLNNISELQKQFNSEDISAEDKSILQGKVDEEISNIKKLYEDTEFDGKKLLRSDRNMDELLNEGFSLENPDNDKLSFVKTELTMRQDDSANRMDKSQNSLDRVNQQYDDALKGAQVVTGTFDPQTAVDNVRFEMLNNIGSKNISDYFTLSASSVFNLLN
ncbi:MAG: hypothetical protein M0R46_12090 [Candidatus Muirbacterium halophilum]|nr:hypothetical protein [Candidatus Muirbacterium halophilum]MCK9476656.1 hypothetical protein [Candidatus Muirbacterium halophilum]